MNFDENNKYTPGLQLLPFGGFEVAVLLVKLQTGGKGGNDRNNETMDYQPMTGAVSSGWLRSKMLAG